MRTEDGLPRFEIICRGKSIGEFTLKVPGRHNVLNSTAAIALACEEGIAPDVARKALAAFGGVKRRCELLGKSPRGVLVYDDYAHHPTEVAATLQGIRDAHPDRRIIVVFQPHLYSRTQDHHESFGAAFVNSDVLLVCDVYGAREAAVPGVTGALVSDSAYRRGHLDARFIAAKENALEILRREAVSDDLILLMGAGNIWNLGAKLLEELV